tara:strand:+ start:17 stop:295 length:279 start_codon:yes stop_codon:yes gene_type:complete
MAQTDLDTEFEKHVKIGADLPPQTADNMLIAYAYYKQATVGDVNVERPQQSSNVIQTFKYDAWKRLTGMDKDEAKKYYIDIIKKLKDGTEED